MHTVSVTFTISDIDYVDDVVQLSLCLDPEHFHRPERKPHTHYIVLPIFSSPSLWWDLSLWICLFGTFQMNAVIRHVAFCDWRLH